MIIRRRVVGLFSKGPMALAWNQNEVRDERGKISSVEVAFRGPFHERCLAPERTLHEVWHPIADVGNERHHPWWHLCIYVGHALRLRRGRCAVDARAKAAAISVFSEGQAVVNA